MQILPLQNPQEGWGYTTGMPHKKNKWLHRTKHVILGKIQIIIPDQMMIDIL